MDKTILQSPKVFPSRGIMSQGVKVPAGNLVFVSGQVARNAQGELVGLGDIKAQTRQTLAHFAQKVRLDLPLDSPGRAHRRRTAPRLPIRHLRPVAFLVASSCS